MSPRSGKDWLILVHPGSLDSYAYSHAYSHGMDLAENLADAMVAAARDHKGPVVVVDNPGMGGRIYREFKAALANTRPDAVSMRFDEDRQKWKPFLSRLTKKIKADGEPSSIQVGGIWWQNDLKSGCASTVFSHLREAFGEKVMVSPDLEILGSENDEHRSNPVGSGKILIGGLAALAGLGIYLVLRPKLDETGSSEDGWRGDFIRAARTRLGTPYEWGGGHGSKWFGLDCSGLIIVALRDAGLSLPPGTPTSGKWWESVPKVTEPQPGDLAFYGGADGVAKHVVIVTAWDPDTRTASIIGANGGDKTVTTPEIALAKDAKVREESTHLYRSGFLGFGSVAEAQVSTS